MARSAETRTDHEKHERPGAEQVGKAERGMMAGAARWRVAVRQGERERHEAEHAGHADIEHPGRTVTIDGNAAGQGAGDEGGRTPGAQRAVAEATHPRLVH